MQKNNKPSQIDLCIEIMGDRLRALYGDGPINSSIIDWNLVLGKDAKENEKKYRLDTLEKVEDILGQADGLLESVLNGMKEDDPTFDSIADLQQNIYTAMCTTSNIRLGGT